MDFCAYTESFTTADIRQISIKIDLDCRKKSCSVFLQIMISNLKIWRRSMEITQWNNVMYFVLLKKVKYPRHF